VPWVVSAALSPDDQVADYALQGAYLPLPNGALLQAAMAMLVVAASERDKAPT
jgi:hypothetical protein